MNPSDRNYSKEHEWAKIGPGDLVTIGITHFAQEQLGDIVYLDLSEIGTTVEQFNKLGEVESVKAVSDIYSPLGGEIVEVNPELVEHPELVNEDPFERGWLVKLNGYDTAEMNSLLTASQYNTFLESEGH